MKKVIKVGEITTTIVSTRKPTLFLYVGLRGSRRHDAARALKYRQGGEIVSEELIKKGLHRQHRGRQPAEIARLAKDAALNEVNRHLSKGKDVHYIPDDISPSNRSMCIGHAVKSGAKSAICILGDCMNKKQYIEKRAEKIQTGAKKPLWLYQLENLLRNPPRRHEGFDGVYEVVVQAK